LKQPFGNLFHIYQKVENRTLHIKHVLLQSILMHLVIFFFFRKPCHL